MIKIRQLLNGKVVHEATIEGDEVVNGELTIQKPTGSDKSLEEYLIRYGQSTGNSQSLFQSNTGLEITRS